MNKGVLNLQLQPYAYSRNGLPIEAFIPREPVEILIIAGIHGEEPETTALLSKAVRSLPESPKTTGFILCANPDGLLLGTRGNASGIDLNRNFASSNWSADTVLHQWKLEEPQSVRLGTGTHPESEPETRGLRILVERLKPTHVVALHAPLGWIDDPNTTALGQWLAQTTNLPLVNDPGYPTPGSFGSWALERGVPLITYELPPISIWKMLENHLESLQQLLQHGLTVLEK
jgi:protein MpaA